ncbi:MAG: DUF4838 domain-containing protein [Phycisphaeraceae bacterium]
MLPALVLTLLALTCTAGEAFGNEALLAEDGQAKLSVVVAEDASDAVRDAAATLADYLSQLSGATFAVKEGDGAEGIVLGRPGDFEHSIDVQDEFHVGPFDREAYVLRSGDAGLWLIGATDLAVRHAVWDVLHRLGHRQYFPGDTWEIIPRHERLALQVDTTQRPDFHARRIWYNWGLWGYNEEPYRQWTQRNRVVQGFSLNSGHAYGGIIQRNREAFDANPEFFALNNGDRRSTGGDLKFCISNVALRQLVVADAVKQVEADPSVDSVSMDPSDGGNWCECEQCADIGSVSDQALTLANEVAQAINNLEHGTKYVGMYAYNQHSPPPSIDAHPNVIISVATGFLRGGYTLDQIVEGWRERGATLGIYDYFSVIVWDWNLPGRARAGQVENLTRRISSFHDDGARFFDAESGDAWGPYGLGYYLAGRVLWDVDEAEQREDLIEHFINDCFAPATEPMAAFYNLITRDDQRRSHSDLLGRMYRHLAHARERATDNPAVLQRLNDLLLYTRYVELYHDYADATGESKEPARDQLLAHTYRMRETMMVHSYGIWARLIGQDAAHQQDHPLHDDRPFETAELTEMLDQGIAENQPVEVDFQTTQYSDDLRPAAEPLRLEEVAQPGSWPTHPQERQHYWLWLDEPGPLPLSVTVQKVWDTQPHRIKLFSPKQVHAEAVDESDAVKPDGERYDVTLNSSFDGLHRLEITDGADHTRLDWPDDMRVTVESGITTTGVTEHFRGAWTLYFYVPRGTELVGGWASRIAAWSPPLSGLVRSGDGEIAYDFSEKEDGFFSIPVPAGQDGKIWKFENSQGQRLLMTVPPYLAPTVHDLLLPAEVIDADAPD